MGAVFLRDVKRFYTPKLLLLLLGAALFSLSARQGFAYSYESFVLFVLVDHYYITFFMVPKFLWISYTYLEDNLDYVLIRISRFPRYFAVKAAAWALNTSVFVLVQLAVIMSVGLGLPAGSGFPSPAEQDLSMEVLMKLSDIVQHPWQASALSVLHLILGLSMLGLVMMTLHHFLEKRWVAVITAGLFILMVFAMKSKIPELTRIPFLFINNYIIFMYNLTYPYAFWVTYISLGMIFGGTVYLICKYWNKDFEWHRKWLRPRGVMPYYAAQLFSFRNVGILATLAIVICLWKWLQLNNLAVGPSTWADYMIYTFWGHGHGYFKPADFLVMLLMNAAPLYMLALFLENEKRVHSMLLTIRLASKIQWASSILAAGSIYVLVYTIGLTTGSLLIPSIAGLPAEGVTMIPDLALSWNEIWVYITAVKWLELLVQFLLMLLVFLWSRQVTAAFGGLLLMYALYLLPYSWTLYIPAGMSSLAQHQPFMSAADSAYEGLPPQTIFLILIVIAVSAVLYILIHGYKRRFQ
ncbi:hypothetical protein ACH6EH_04220 [Paenibacillus sp. JSM ZJ436]|uniref:hypothetical protein n=1 Tax=Paenibacillus sp. JSM ZJ436 TaxID=3376190 RepID=UPI00378F85DA